MMNLSNIIEALQPIAVGVHRLPQPKTKISGISTDTRTIERGNLYIALTGERYDGHAFIKDAFQAGAAAAVVSEEWFNRNTHSHYSLIIVRQPLEALGRIALWWRRRFKIPVVCIAGSNGKTTTKELIAAVLAQKFKVHKTEENLNNKIGVSKMILGITPKHKAAVLELGTNRSGEIAWLCRVAEPTHGVITNIGKDHIQYLKSMEGVAGENGDLFAFLGAHNGIAFVNGDDRLVKYQASYRGVKKSVEFSFVSRAANVRGKLMGMNPDGGARFSFSARGKGSTSVNMRTVGEHVAYNALAAAAIGLQFGVRKAAIKRALESYLPDETHEYGRLRVERIPLDGRRGRTVTVLNDTYNANPESMYAALDTLFTIKPRSRHIAILGDMLELGELSKPEHEAIGIWLLDSDIDEVYFVGEEMFHAYEAIKSNRRLNVPLPPVKKGKKPVVRKRVKVQDVPASYFPVAEKEQLIDVLTATLRNDDIVLVKGSRGMRMEEIITTLKKNVPPKPAKRK